VAHELLLGPEGYQALLDELEGKASKTPARPQKPESRDARGQLMLDGSGFNEDLPLLPEEE